MTANHLCEGQLGQPSTTLTWVSHSEEATLGKSGREEFLFTVGIHAPFFQLLAPWDGPPSLGTIPPGVGAAHY